MSAALWPTRRGLGLGAAAAAAFAAAPIAPARAATPLPRSEWAAFKAAFVSGDGAVRDTGNGGISHSEGQGYAMLLAVALDDPAGFLGVWRWTRETLRVRDDALFAWRWRPETGQVEDPNNASDGDLLIAWALLRAASRWGETAWRDEAGRILADLARLCVVDRGGGPLLLPGAEGFLRDEGVVINPAYWVFPALSLAARLDPEGPWSGLFASGEALLDAFAATGLGLPPDWCLFGEAIGPAEGFSFAFGFDAIRAPLYHRWATPAERARPRVAPAAAWARRNGGPARTPATVDLRTGVTAAYPISPGGQAVLRLALATVDGVPPVLPPWSDGLDYYAAVLLLLSKLAASEALP
jgi:endoglucanase